MCNLSYFRYNLCMKKKALKFLFIFFLITVILFIGEYLVINPLIRKACGTENPIVFSCDKAKILTYYPTHLVKRIICTMQNRNYEYSSSFFVRGGYRCLPNPVPLQIVDY